MILAIKFNDSFKASKGNDFALGMYAAYAYGSNSFCFEQAERLQGPANDDRAIHAIALSGPA